MAAALSAITGWLLFAALVASIGAVAGRWIVIPRALASEPIDPPHVDGPSIEWMRATVTRFGTWSAWLLPPALALYFVRQLHEFRDPFSPWRDEAALLLTGTSWGATWTLGLAGSVVAAAAFLWARAGHRSGWWVATPTVLALGAFPAFTGHAAGEEHLRTLALGADTLHVWAASAWIGGLAVVLFLEARWRRTSPGEPASLLPWLVPAFSPLAILCVAILVGTGLFASWLHLPGVEALLTTGYGRILILKLLLVAVVMGFGALNWKRLTPRLGEPGGGDALRKAATTEFLVAQAVLLVTAVLVRTSPLDH